MDKSGNSSIRYASLMPEHVDLVAELIYESSHELFNFMFSNPESAIAVLKKLLAYENGHFGKQFVTVMLVDDKVVGAELGYDHAHLTKQEIPGAINIFRATPFALWSHFIGPVRKALDGYVPAPAEDAYYINNIAVDSRQRGLGLGKKLLDHVIATAANNNYRCVELDVTQDNDGAIKFYERYGFYLLSQSGTEQLEEQYDLPKLNRMRLALSNDNKYRADNFSEKNSSRVINDVTHLNPVEVDEVYVPGSVEQLQAILQTNNKPISIGGGRFSMGGQTAQAGTLHIDLRGLNKIIELDPEKRLIRVQAGIRWKSIQTKVADYGLAVKIMQTYSNFTVGGSISVNCHGRYIGLGPVILSVQSLLLLMHDGALIKASPEENTEVFYTAVGGYGAVGIIVEAELSLAENSKIERIQSKMNTDEYATFFTENIRNNTNAVFHNADMAPPNFDSLRAITWQTTDKSVTSKKKKTGLNLYLAEKYMLWAITETPLGHMRRKYIYEPLLYMRPKILFRNDEADYDVSELEPLSRNETTYVLQEYFVPVNRLVDFTNNMATILKRYSVQVVNVSIRHAHSDPGSVMAWAREEVFALVLYYKQGAAQYDQLRVAIWTRELIDAVIVSGGSYYLPYQPHARFDQFYDCYPNAEKFFEIKDKLDPDYRFRNSLWEKYYHCSNDKPLLGDKNVKGSEFLTVYGNVVLRDNFYRFLQNIYHLYPEHRFHGLIVDACHHHEDDQTIYQTIVERLPSIKTFLSDLRYALPALVKQKNEMQGQTEDILQGCGEINGYLEIGSTGRYVKSLCKSLNIIGLIHLTNDVRPDMSLPELMERGSFKEVGAFFDLDNYLPIKTEQIADKSVDLVTCYIGLHHVSRERLTDYITSIHRVLRPGGHFILRDHDAGTDEMRLFCSLVHTVFNAGLGVNWEDDRAELRLFEGIDFWVEQITRLGFSDSGQRLLQDYDPSLNTLLCFTRE